MSNLANLAKKNKLTEQRNQKHLKQNKCKKIRSYRHIKIKLLNTKIRKKVFKVARESTLYVRD